LTESGRRLLDEILGPLLELQTRQFAHFDKSELRLLMDLLFRARHRDLKK
jgi:hypothetical protein